jgi:DNA topoisomerase-1
MRTIDRLVRDGIRRLGTPRSGFRWVRPRGRPIGGEDLARIRALRLPPGWTDVHVSPAGGAKVQAIGRDRAGRWQYRYHPDFTRRRAEAKYARLVRFAGALPRIRARVERDLRRRGLGRERVLAAMVRILDVCRMRPGSEAYARENRSYGLTTVRPRHVAVEGDRVIFTYRGKSGQRQVRELEDPSIARIVRELLRVPGRDVFKFVDGGEIVDVRRRHLNAYLREVSGGPFTAKDFRTWAGTVLCAHALARAHRDPGPPARDRRKVAVAAVKAVAERLGNTPAVARSAYISPVVLEAFERGEVVRCDLDPYEEEHVAPRRGLHDLEEALVALLAAHARRGAVVTIVRGGGRGARPVRAASGASKPLRRAARSAED